MINVRRTAVSVQDIAAFSTWEHACEWGGMGVTRMTAAIGPDRKHTIGACVYCETPKCVLCSTGQICC